MLEFNVRLGDPETQPVMMRLKSDLVELCVAALDQKLDKVIAQWDSRAALGVVLAAGGYPGSYDKEAQVSGQKQSFGDHVKVFHAGTATRDASTITSGGRVLCVTALGETVAAAQRAAYAAVDRISWQGMFCRRDIGYRAIARE